MSLADAGPVLLIGAGKMGMAMAKGWVRAGLPGASLTLVKRTADAAVSQFAQDHGATLQTDLPADPPKFMVLAVKPQAMAATMADARALVGPQTVAISVAAGLSSERIATGLGTDSVIWAMPNLSVQVGKGMTGAFARSGVSEQDRALAEALLGATGAVSWVDREELMHALTAVSGSGPGYVFNMVEAMAAAGQAQGLDADAAMVLARQTIVGAAAMLETDPQPAAQMRRNVASPNGVTQAGLDVLMAQDGLGALMDRAIAAARRRSEELGQ